MIEKFSFYFRHSFNDLRVNGQRTFFALLCIAAGVAAVVSLQTVALMIGDTLTGNLQATNRGDIQASLEFGFNDDEQGAILEQAVAEGLLEELPSSGFGGAGAQTQYIIGAEGVAQIQAWIDSTYPDQIELTYPWVISDIAAIFTGGIGTSVTDSTTGDSGSQVTPVLIDPAVYPFYDEIESVDGTPLSELIQSPTDIVIDEKLAETLGVEVGATLRVSGADVDFTLRGIVPTEAEVTSPTTGIFAALFGFYYLERDAIQYFEGLTGRTDKLYLKLADPTMTAEVNRAFLTQYPYLETDTVDTLRQDNEALANQINQVVTVVGLVSLLLGSIGIINTMQVIVRRRTVEVAVLKTIGLEAGEVTMLFLVEAFIMGVLGSILGILLGWATTFVIKGVAESLVAQALPFRIALAPIVNGIIVGTLVTTIFGFLPTLAAGQVRPGVVLRPSDTIIPRAGLWRTLGALIIIIAALSGVSAIILGNLPTAILVTIGAFIASGILVLLLSFLIWIIGRFFPSLGIVDLKISLRQMLAGRGRGATTLLALVVGVFSLSLITLFADTINNTLSTALGSASGGNVIVAMTNRNSIPQVTAALDETEGVVAYQVSQSFGGTLVSMEKPDGALLDRDAIMATIEENSNLRDTIAAFGGDPDEIDVGEIVLAGLSNLSGIDLGVTPSTAPTAILRGRDFTDADAGQPVIIFTESDNLTSAEIEVGAKLIYEFGEDASAQQITLEVIGIRQRPVINSPTSGSGTQIPLDALPSVIAPSTIQALVNIADENIPELRRTLSTVPGTFVLETAVFVQLLSSLLATFSAFPTMVALLGLVVGGVVIANSVALTTLERRREIAVMKAVGLQRERVLGMILLENGIMGLIGGLIGVGLGVLMLVILLSASGSSLSVIPFGTALLLMGLCIGVALIAATTTAWGASGEKPLNVLRSE